MTMCGGGRGELFRGLGHECERKLARDTDFRVLLRLGVRRTGGGHRPPGGRIGAHEETLSVVEPVSPQPGQELEQVGNLLCREVAEQQLGHERSRLRNHPLDLAI